ncbi:MAG: chorismate mutase [Myxococcales bacterium]|nr:chorismate mutase [Myxococcales bacterium]
MGHSQEEPERIREALRQADQALAEALDARARAVREAVALRERSPDLYFSLPRDHEVIAYTTERVKELPAQAVSAVMTEVLSACSALVAPPIIAYVGQAGGFGHQAARKKFGSSAVLRPVDSAAEVLSEVERGQADFGIVPFETSHDGAVTATLNLLARSELKISAEIPIRRAFHLISQSGERDEVHKIYASSSAIAACEHYLAEHFPEATIIDVRNGVIAADHAAREPDAAALTTDLVATTSKLTIVERSLEDVEDLETRYVAVGNDFPPRTGLDRTAVALALHDAPGVLMECLRPFADRKLNLYRLETRPARGWEFRYLILFEVDGHITDRSVLAAIEELRGSSRYVKVLGSYPRSA